jgi:hypothetical protein
MKNPFKTQKNNVLVPVVIGLAAAGAIVYLLLADDTADLRGKITDNLDKSWRTVKEKVPAGTKAPHYPHQTMFATPYTPNT